MDIFLAQKVASRMLKISDDSYRSIIFVTSVSVDMVSVERAAMMVQLFAVRLAQDNIGVFEVRPGIIETNMTSGVKDKYTDLIESGLVSGGA